MVCRVVRRFATDGQRLVGLSLANSRHRAGDLWLGRYACARFPASAACHASHLSLPRSWLLFSSRHRAPAIAVRPRAQACGHAASITFCGASVSVSACSVFPLGHIAHHLASTVLWRMCSHPSHQLSQLCCLLGLLHTRDGSRKHEVCSFCIVLLVGSASCPHAIGGRWPREMAVSGGYFFDCLSKGICAVCLSILLD